MSESGERSVGLTCGSFVMIAIIVALFGNAHSESVEELQATGREQVRLLKKQGKTLARLEKQAQRAPAQATPAPRAGEELNPFVLGVLQRYPLDGSFAFHWPRTGSWEGTTRDLFYAGRQLTTGDPQRRSYCCGLTFEVYVQALLEANAGAPIPGLTADTLHELRLRFFGDSSEGERRRLVQFGLESLNLGRALERLEDARAGDFVQFWRHSGSGHSAIFINWRWRNGEVVGLTYWSTQSSTQGIGYHTEAIGPAGVKRDEIYLARAGWPLAGR